MATVKKRTFSPCVFVSKSTLVKLENRRNLMPIPFHFFNSVNGNHIPSETNNLTIIYTYIPLYICTETTSSEIPANDSCTETTPSENLANNVDESSHTGQVTEIVTLRDVVSTEPELTGEATGVEDEVQWVAKRLDLPDVNPDPDSDYGSDADSDLE